MLLCTMPPDLVEHTRISQSTAYRKWLGTTRPHPRFTSVEHLVVGELLLQEQFLVVSRNTLIVIDQIADYHGIQIMRERKCSAALTFDRFYCPCIR